MDRLWSERDEDDDLYISEQEAREAECGHEWVISEETDRCCCLNCGADGDA